MTGARTRDLAAAVGGIVLAAAVGVAGFRVGVPAPDRLADVGLFVTRECSPRAYSPSCADLMREVAEFCGSRPGAS